LGCRTKQEYDTWFASLVAATTYEGPVVEIHKQMKQSITVQFTPDFGYVVRYILYTLTNYVKGFPIEWKQLFRDHAIVEKQFFEHPMEVINQLKFNKSSTPIVSHHVANSQVSIGKSINKSHLIFLDDVINKKGSPDMYVGYQLLGSGYG
jgi:hypothetical protein